MGHPYVKIKACASRRAQSQTSELKVLKGRRAWTRRAPSPSLIKRVYICRLTDSSELISEKTGIVKESHRLDDLGAAPRLRTPRLAVGDSERFKLASDKLHERLQHLGPDGRSLLLGDRA